MGLRKVLILLTTLFVFILATFSLACKKPNNEVPPVVNPMEGVETLQSIPESQIKLSATATKTANSSWFIKYADKGIEVKVYVEDEIIYQDKSSLYYSDNVEVIIDKAQDEDGYSSSTVSVTVDSQGRVSVVNLSKETEVKDSGVTVSSKIFTFNGEKKDGYYTVITIPYDLVGISLADKDAVICLGLFNADSKSSFEMSYHEGINTVRDSVKTYSWLNEDNTLTLNPYYYKRIDGVRFDGERDTLYGDFTDTVLLDNDRWYNVSAVKTENGVAIYSQGLFNTSTTNPYETDWGKVTNFEFKLNHGNVSYVTFNGLNQNVSEVFTKIEEIDGKYLHTVEFFVEKELIMSWLDNGRVYLNYAWKSPNEGANILSDMIDVRLNDWGSTDWHARHRLGGLATATFDSEEVLEPYNLEIDNIGLTTVTSNSNEFTIDGNLTEYGNYWAVKGNKDKAKVELNGKVNDGNLYLAIRVIHNSWGQFNQMWYKNDNFEMKINGKHIRLIFIDGKLILPASITQGASTTIEEGGKLVTSVELFFSGNEKEYQVKMATCGEGFGVDFQPIFWDGGDTLFVNEDGIISIDGVFGESMWATSSKCSTTANGANIVVQAEKMKDGVIFGVKVDHKKAPEVSVNGETNWWNYMGVELHFNGSDTAYITTCRNDENSKNLYPYCFTTKNSDDSYTSVFEIYVEYKVIGTTADAELTFSVGGWYENDWAWLWGGNATTMTHKVTADGVAEL